MSYDSTNEMFRLAVELVNQSSRNIFLTGKAGTGKTTFLKYIRETCPKQLAVVAPTGVAAINAGGVTIHSFFQLPFSPFIPDAGGFAKGNDSVVNRQGLLSRLRFNREKIKILRQLELIIIDEISMVRCDTLDAIDTVLRFARKRPYERFGGVQMLLIGDMFQLPPVIKEVEWNMLSKYYGSPYFFDSAVIRAEPPAYIEFNKIYRQSEERFIRVLNQVRNNELDTESMQVLEERYRPSFPRSENDGYIILTTHNETAKNVNNAELSKLTSRTYEYKADIEGEMNESAYPADEILRLKEGSQVMFIKNDSEKNKRYFNGKLGTVTSLNYDKITVRCRDEDEDIEIGKEKWENIRYTLNKTSGIMEEEVLGSFTQYPLRLAWAITIHKSQGLTFEKAIIDAGDAFAAGQVYVALSRCTNLEGMILNSKIRINSLATDQGIMSFAKTASSSDQLKEGLVQAKKDYELRLLLATFDFRAAIDTIKDLQRYLVQNKESFNIEVLPWTEELADRLNKLQDTANKFQLWVKAQFGSNENPAISLAVQERVIKASGHFILEIDSLIIFLQNSVAVTDSRQHAKEFNDSVKEIFAELSAKRYLLQGCSSKFNVDEWHKRKREFVLPLFTINAYAGAGEYKQKSPHPLLYQQLKKLRDAICLKKDLPIYIVAGSRTLDEMVEYLPQTLEGLRKVSGFGDAKIERYGQQFLDIIFKYCVENNLSSLIHEKSPKRERKQNNNGERRSKAGTKEQSLKLHQEGKSIMEIAIARNLSVQTIEGHLSHYVSTGDINIRELISQQKIDMILPALQDFEGGVITPIKEKLGHDVSFGEIKLVLAWRQFQKSQPDQIGLTQ